MLVLCQKLHICTYNRQNFSGDLLLFGDPWLPHFPRLNCSCYRTAPAVCPSVDHIVCTQCTDAVYCYRCGLYAQSWAVQKWLNRCSTAVWGQARVGQTSTVSDGSPDLHGKRQFCRKWRRDFPARCRQAFPLAGRCDVGIYYTVWLYTGAMRPVANSNVTVCDKQPIVVGLLFTTLQWRLTWPSTVNSSRWPPHVDHTLRPVLCTARWAVGRDGVVQIRIRYS